jgi:hypothetical protein
VMYICFGHLMPKSGFPANDLRLHTLTIPHPRPYGKQSPLFRGTPPVPRIRSVRHQDYWGAIIRMRGPSTRRKGVGSYVISAE